MKDSHSKAVVVVVVIMLLLIGLGFYYVTAVRNSDTRPKNVETESLINL